MKIVQLTLASCLLFGCWSLSWAGEAPWGSASTLDINYAPEKALYDVRSGDVRDLASVLDRVSYLYKLQGSDPLEGSIIVVIHGSAIPFFAIDEYAKHRDIMRRAQSLTVGTTIEFRMCRAAAKLLNYEPDDIHGFVKMVPMADAEIVRLQHAGYAYMQ